MTTVINLAGSGLLALVVVLVPVLILIMLGGGDR